MKFSLRTLNAVHNSKTYRISLWLVCRVDMEKLLRNFLIVIVRLGSSAVDEGLLESWKHGAQTKQSRTSVEQQGLHIRTANIHNDYYFTFYTDWSRWHIWNQYSAGVFEASVRLETQFHTLHHIDEDQPVPDFVHALTFSSLLEVTTLFTLCVEWPKQPSENAMPAFIAFRIVGNILSPFRGSWFIMLMHLPQSSNSHYLNSESNAKKPLVHVRRSTYHTGRMRIWDWWWIEMPPFVHQTLWNSTNYGELINTQVARNNPSSSTFWMGLPTFKTSQPQNEAHRTRRHVQHSTKGREVQSKRNAQLRGTKPCRYPCFRGLRRLWKS